MKIIDVTFLMILILYIPILPILALIVITLYVTDKIIDKIIQ